MTLSNQFQNTLDRLHSSGNYRFLHDQPKEGILDLCSNDYLGLNSNTDLYNQFLENYKIHDSTLSASSSRLLSGNSAEYKKLENTISTKYHNRSCLIFNSGYHANTGIMPALAGAKDLILADKLVHASIIDGAKLSNANFKRYAHLNYQHLEDILLKNRRKYNNVFIISESIFSMDGDLADLSLLVEIKKRYNCYLYIDEAHAVGAIGKQGLGCSEKLNLINEIDFIIGTFGKALASVGAYVICNPIFKDYLINHCRTLIYTTALPPVNLAWTNYIFNKLDDLNDLRKELTDLSNHFGKLLNVKANSHIIPFIIGENNKAQKKSELLNSNGYYVLPIRYPTVPAGTARLRFSLRANIKLNQLKPITNLLSNNE
jgi:8-amino-7-oxononanoate synthase